MHLYKKHKTWMIETVIGGKKIRKSTGQHDRAQAEAIAALLMTAKRTRADAVRDGLHELLDKLLDSSSAPRRTPLDVVPVVYKGVIKSIGRDNITQDTLATRIGHYTTFAAWAKKFGHVNVEEISGPVAAAYAEHLAKQAKKSKTRKNTIGNLSTIWRMLAKRIPGLADPWKDLTPHITDATTIMPFTLEEEERVIKAARRLHGGIWYMPSLVARHTGLREGDVSSLTWDNIDLERGVISTTPNKTRRHKIAVSVPIAAVLMPELNKLAAGKCPRSYGSKRSAGTLVFPALANMSQLKSSQRKPFALVLDAAGIDGKTHTFHSWRHTAATRMGAAGVDMETRKLILGHTTDAMAEHYDHDQHMAAKRRAVDAAAKKKPRRRRSG